MCQTTVKLSHQLSTLQATNMQNSNTRLHRSNCQFDIRCSRYQHNSATVRPVTLWPSDLLTVRWPCDLATDRQVTS